MCYMLSVCNYGAVPTLTQVTRSVQTQCRTGTAVCHVVEVLSAPHALIRCVLSCFVRLGTQYRENRFEAKEIAQEIGIPFG
jgi:hypothetical protein